MAMALRRRLVRICSTVGAWSMVRPSNGRRRLAVAHTMPGATQLGLEAGHGVGHDGGDRGGRLGVDLGADRAAHDGARLRGAVSRQRRGRARPRPAGPGYAGSGWVGGDANADPFASRARSIQPSTTVSALETSCRAPARSRAGSADGISEGRTDVVAGGLGQSSAPRGAEPPSSVEDGTGLPREAKQALRRAPGAPYVEDRARCSHPPT